jgi:hypothetical protein
MVLSKSGEKMNRFFVLAIGIVWANSAMAVAVLSESGEVFGVSPRNYRGEGRLIAKSRFTPNLKYHSTRNVGHGQIHAKTDAFLFGIHVGEAEADLQVVVRDNNTFDMINMRTGKVAGAGSCDEKSCSFTATVMEGALTLSETWVAHSNGFDIVRGEQSINGSESTYTGRFIAK